MSTPYPPVDGTEMCARTDPDAWFPEAGNFSHRYGAPTLCDGCHVQVECLEFALTATAGDRPVVGVWGGTTNPQRQRIRAQRARDERAA